MSLGWPLGHFQVCVALQLAGNALCCISVRVRACRKTDGLIPSSASSNPPLSFEVVGITYYMH